VSLVVERGDSVRDGAGKSIGIGEGAVGELMLLEVAPASFDIAQLGAYFGSHSRVSQGRWARLSACCGGFRCRAPRQRPGAFGGAVGGAELVDQGEEVGGALGRAGVHEKAP